MSPHTTQGQRPNQPRLLHLCQKSSIDIIPLAFVDIFSAQGNGFPGTNFGNRCWGGTYSALGYNGSSSQAFDALQPQCPTLVQDIPIYQSTYRKKIVLPLGGATDTYQLQGVTDGRNFADFLWGAPGATEANMACTKPARPFDGPRGQAVEVDRIRLGHRNIFQWHKSLISVSSTLTENPDSSAGYIALISRLHSHFQSSRKKYLITGAPQCRVPDAEMGTMISAVPHSISSVFNITTPPFTRHAQRVDKISLWHGE